MIVKFGKIMIFLYHEKSMKYISTEDITILLYDTCVEVVTKPSFVQSFEKKCIYISVNCCDYNVLWLRLTSQ